MERTLNMYSMDVTLDVSRLSGWLYADAPCGVGGGGMVIVGQEKGRRVGRGVIKTRARWIQVGVQAAAGRTSNMLRMVVTPEVIQPEMSALKLPMPLKSSAMSLMEETPQ